jgi:hypothetical protein
MEKWMCYGTLAIAAIMLIVFLMDMFTKTPFGGGDAFVALDIFGILASGIVGYLGFNALRDMK